MCLCVFNFLPENSYGQKTKTNSIKKGRVMDRSKTVLHLSIIIITTKLQIGPVDVKGPPHVGGQKLQNYFYFAFCLTGSYSSYLSQTFISSVCLRPPTNSKHFLCSIIDCVLSGLVIS